MISIFSHTASSYSKLVTSRTGKGNFYAELIYKTWIRKGILYHEESNAKALISKMIGLTDFSMPIVGSEIMSGDTKKVFLKTFDGLAFEMVILPMKAGLTLCVSSQVGCKMGCSFCQTGKMGLIRSLSIEEIVSQLFIARHVFQAKIRNIVFMGMGEPFDNYDNVMQAIQIFTDPKGFGLSPKNITVSTSGLVDKILQFSKEADASLNLAISVNAPTDIARNKLMPINKRFDLKLLRESMEVYLQHPKREIFVEYVLIEGKNNSLEDAKNLSAFLEGLRVKINLIPYNQQSKAIFQRPSKQTVDEFTDYLKAKGFLVFLRNTKGDNIMAACGQLGKKMTVLIE